MDMPIASSDAARLRASRAAALAGLSFAVLAAQLMTVIMLGAGMAPGYDVAGGAISDLGTVPETAWLFNGSLLLTGALEALGGILLFRAGRGPWTLAIALIAALGAAGAGLFPLGQSGLHGLFALFAFLFFNLQTVLTARAVGGPARPLGYALGAIGLGFVVLMVIGDAGNPWAFGPIGHGGAERMIVYPPMIWLMILGGYLMGTASPGPGRGLRPAQE